MKSFKESDSMTNITNIRKVFKSRLKILYGSCNVNEDITNVCPPVMLILPEIWNSWLQKLSF